MKAFVLGAGAQGAACASILARDSRAEKVILADIDLPLAEKVKVKINSPKIKAVKADAGNPDEVIKAAEGSDIIFDMTLPPFTVNIMKAALQLKAHYVNTAFGRHIMSQVMNGEKPELFDEFKEARLTALLGCGETPGLLNVCVRYYCDRLDTVKSVKLRGGGCSMIPVPRVRPWYPGWSPAQALIDFTVEPVVFRNGKYERLPIFAEQELYDFGTPVGELWVAHHMHEEPVTIPYSIGKGISHCEFKYQIDEQAGTFIKMGFTPNNEIEVKGTKIKPFDVLMALTEHPGDTFFTEKAPTEKELAHVYLSIIEIEGTKGNVPVKYKIQVPPLKADPFAVYEACGTLTIEVALPAVTGGVMCMEGTEKGVIFAEQLNPVRFIELLNEKIPYKVKEL